MIHPRLPADLAAHLQQHLSPQRFTQILGEDTVLVAEVEGHIIGYAQFGPAAEEGEWELRRLYVQRQFQNQGTGSRLMEAALAHPGMQAAETITLDVWEHNPLARRFYERYGFVVVGQRRFTVASGAETSLDLVMIRQRPGG